MLMFLFLLRHPILRAIATLAASAFACSPTVAQPVGVAAAAAAAIRVDDLLVLALGPTDRSAVIKLPDGQVLTLKVGDPVPGAGAVLSDVTSEQILLDLHAAQGRAAQRIWMAPAKGGKPGRLVRYLTRVDPVETRFPPAVTVTALSPGGAGASSLAPRPGSQ